MFLAFSTAKAQDLKEGQIYVIYEHKVKDCPEEKNSYSFFYVLSSGEDFAVSEAIFNKERGKFFIELDFVHNRDDLKFKEYMTSPILPVIVEEGEVLMPKYK